MKTRTRKVIDIVRDVKKQNEYAVPVFQRSFVWSPAQVRDLADSLITEYPIGCLLTWRSRGIERGDGNDEVNRTWIIDGQQRVTALSLICREPLKTYLFKPARPPSDYAREMKLLENDLFTQQRINDPSNTRLDDYKAWLSGRAKLLAKKLNERLTELSSS